MEKLLLAAVLTVSTFATAHAQTVVFGAGYSDFSEATSEDQALIALEYHHTRFHQATRFSAGWGAAFSVDEDGDTHIGVGLVGLYSLGERWFVEGSVMPGYFNASNDQNDLGGDFQIRSLLGLGYNLNNGNRMSVAITHKSNASTNDENPGVNAVLLRYHLGF
ncbi:acyloxyacyl hydrolase [Ruegeria atlantica]|uniref:Acyloxyacyl hydrolase n=1 Tax=Ruegeria atlantica TaxID=81569 RepID=A0AA90ZG17_9RHOB|nr:acyloxyacyl hydrolase [Ruegeria atlantica]NOE18689.1 acyloxyacyl hydrolase [Ruegeria atlantica]